MLRKYTFQWVSQLVFTESLEWSNTELSTSQALKERSPSKAYSLRGQPFYPTTSKFVSIFSLLHPCLSYICSFPLSQTLLFQSWHPSSAILSLCASQSPSFVKSCPTCLLFLPVYSHLPLPCYSASLPCSDSSGSLSFPVSVSYTTIPQVAFLIFLSKKLQLQFN